MSLSKVASSLEQVKINDDILQNFPQLGMRVGGLGLCLAACEAEFGVGCFDDLTTTEV
jgi:hypothetical protein